ncbi:MAG TPA: hypothetical protein VJQ55_18400 [Candidatus Binatia bacterium]|nr:hypothetical protein [Candidatus Binatia bacterium]
MRLGLIVVMLLLAACAPSQPSRPKQGPSAPSGSGAAAGRSSGSAVTAEAAPATSYSQDAVECERKAALSQAGSKGEAFTSCMRSKGHTPGRP